MSLARQSISTLLRLGEEKLAQMSKQEEQHLFWYQDNSVEIKGTPHNKAYKPSPTGLDFHNDDSFVRLIMGPYGSGKTTTCINEIIRRTCDMPPWHNGRRKARWAIIRNTSGELHTTTLQTWLAWCDELGVETHRSKPLLQYEHIFRDDYGVVELELVFMALDRPDDIRKLKSLEVTGAYLNEASELPSVILSHLKGRLNGRYPSKAFCPQPYWSGIIADTNPPDEDHWIYEQFYANPTEGYKLFRQPPGLIKEDGGWLPNPGAENIQHLSPDYYTKLATGQKEDFVKVFCCGDWGIVESGKRVFPEYNADLHSVETINPVEGLDIHLGVDFGLTPACVVVQITARGQLLILREFVSDGMGIRDFMEAIVLPGLAKYFPDYKIGLSRADPSGNARDTISSELSCISEMCNMGINTEAARSNNLEPRLNGIKYFLGRMIDGKPGFLLSRTGCPTIHKGLARDYVYKRLAVPGEERYRDVPEKNSTSHAIDGLQYVVMEFAADYISKSKRQEADISKIYNPIPHGYMT